MYIEYVGRHTVMAIEGNMVAFISSAKEIPGKYVDGPRFVAVFNEGTTSVQGLQTGKSMCLIFFIEACGSGSAHSLCCGVKIMESDSLLLMGAVTSGDGNQPELGD